MRRTLSILLACFALLPWVVGQNVVSVVGNAIDIADMSGVDHIFVFEDLTGAEIQTPADATWYKYANGDSTLFQSGVAYLYPEHNTGYIVRYGDKRTTFWVIDYSACAITLNSLTIDPLQDDPCLATCLLLDADIPAINYQTIDGRTRSIDRQAEITYTSLAWDGEMWQDSACVEEHSLSRRICVGAPLCNTNFTLGADQLAKQLNLQVDSVRTDMYEAVAVAIHPVTTTTIRGTETENQRTNEVDRPTETTQLSGSAPLDILFTANGNMPVAKYYLWKIYKGTELIVQRTDPEHRYTFDDFGEYRVVVYGSNDVCQTDSIEISVSVSLSQLLVPNVFTPNGDGHNDEFRVSYRSIIEFECWIYNRWGRLVYHFTDPAKGWDGNIGGRPAAEGVYYYIIRARGADAEEGAKYHRATAKRPADVGVYQLSGDINLIRGKKN